MICLIDNYDSFTYNLYQYIGEFDPDIVVRRNDEITIEEIERISPDRIILSPGPGHPSQAGITVELILEFAHRIPILGICLGHQAIGLAMGGTVDSANSIVHGKQSNIYHEGEGLFKNIPSPFQAVRYHSLAVMKDDFPDSLEIHGYTDDGTIMALKHKEYPLYGLQFHPESILSDYGKELLKNFLAF
ncbi:aminodeoxychorismate/anthranilate synthase component 2 [Ruminiclostridium hungatei]|uniref:Aminodeoxychorismate/anthranilate synthase component 2 n=1 Tax=Ruminiclostridium hungatei TaxID=48256 RepID=A0A1V4SMN3_RUMHU|nr:aminodeoxychorismate/anthranilate synthase component II [Ruminiclostridium hungatei]OPX45149.1 aminodeoxychorismate/anthranilate synthase component 2 [Ruminiclostridium hungatei]